jgi:probable O-glycosylation ligase (exosortase A-associated)
VSSVAIPIGVAGSDATRPAGDAWWRPVRTRSAAAVTAVTGSPVAFWALVAFTVILLLSPQAWFPILKLVRIAFLAASISIAAHIVERTVHRQPVTPMSPEIGVVLALVAWAVITTPMSVWPGGSIRLLTDQYLKAIAFFGLLSTVVTTSGRMRALAWALVLCSVPLAATGVKNYLFGDHLLATGVRGFSRISGYMGGSGLTGNPNDLALMLNLLIPIAGALALIERGLKRSVAVAAMLLAMAGVIVTFSRAGFLTLAATFVMFLAVLARRKSPAIAIALLLVAMCAPPLLPSGYMNRLSTITDIESDKTGSAQGRWQDFKVATDLVIDSPIVGAGLGNDAIVLNQERGRDTWRSVHNAYLQYAVDLGIPGLLLFAWLHLMCLRSARLVEKRATREPRLRDLGNLAAGVQIALVGFFVAALFHPIAYQFYFFSVAGLAVALKNTCRAEIALARAEQPAL